MELRRGHSKRPEREDKSDRADLGTYQSLYHRNRISTVSTSARDQDQAWGQLAAKSDRHQPIDCDCRIVVSRTHCKSSSLKLAAKLKLQLIAKLAACVCLRNSASLWRQYQRRTGDWLISPTRSCYPNSMSLGLLTITTASSVCPCHSLA